MVMVGEIHLGRPMMATVVAQARPLHTFSDLVAENTTALARSILELSDLFKHAREVNLDGEVCRQMGEAMWSPPFAPCKDPTDDHLSLPDTKQRVDEQNRQPTNAMDDVRSSDWRELRNNPSFTRAVGEKSGANTRVSHRNV
nr:hypothetical protein Itr_chr13CG08390 [Ipomoea trifida]